jgi:hypothetical protein
MKRPGGGNPPRWPGPSLRGSRKPGKSAQSRDGRGGLLAPPVWGPSGNGVRCGPESGSGAGRARRVGRHSGQLNAGIFWQGWPRVRDGLQAERLEAIRTPRLCRAALSRRRRGRYSMKIAGAAMSGGVSAGDTPKPACPTCCVT